MTLCILATNENVEIARSNALAGMPAFNGHQLLSIPCSPTGEMPATHWFCQFIGSQEACDKLIALKQVTEMEIGEPAAFLNARNLKVIRRK